MPRPGPRYPSRRFDPLRGAQLGVSVRRAEAEPKELELTPYRRGLLEAVKLGRVRYYPSSGWRCSGKAVNAVVRECVAAGWLKESLEGSLPIRRTIALTDLGRAALGTEEPA
ncbi:MAG TPA: hypothetical protein VF484_00830 [Candidatus Limnocylindrales bacterium]